MTTKKLHIGGMSCVNCQSKIEKTLKGTAGIESAEVSYNDGTADVTYDSGIITLKEIVTIIESLDYVVLSGDPQIQGQKIEQKNGTTSRTIGMVVIIFALYMLMQHFGFAALSGEFPLAEAGMGYGMLFIIGLITSVHCVAMCGGINLSQSIPQNAEPQNAELHTEVPHSEDKRLRPALRPTLLYNLGRVISYTIVGAFVGALGAIVSFSGAMKGVVQLAAGAFMVIMGINMLGIFPFLRKLTPRMPRIFARKVEAEKGQSKSPLYVGLLNGLMPCGPLQAMQLYALSTGDPIKGALSMLLFSLGTVPLMFGLGALSSILSKKFTRKVMTVGAVLVASLGLTMFSNGWSLSGFAIPSNNSRVPMTAYSEATYTIENGVQMVNSTLSSGRYPAITVQAGLPVRWTINAPQGSINGCNNRMIIPEYNLEHQFRTGSNNIEFTPEKTGKIRYSCWMGMIRSTITVLDAGADIPSVAASAITAPSAPVPAGYTIPTENIAVAVFVPEEGLQKIRINLTDEGFAPAVVVIQAGARTEWIINNDSIDAGSSALLVPAYYQALPLQRKSENRIFFYPVDDFDFSTADSIFYGYVKVVSDIGKVDLQAVKREVTSHETLIYSDEHFASAGQSASCCR